MNRLKALIGITALSLIVLALPSVASAQWGRNNGGYYGNGQYSRDIKGTAQNLKRQAKDFEKMVDRYDDRRDRRQSANLERLADDFKKAADRFEDKYGNGRNLNNSSDAARRLLDIGSQIDRALYASRGNVRLQSSWNRIRNDLNIVAGVYGYNNNNRNRNNRRANFPFPF